MRLLYQDQRQYEFSYRRNTLDFPMHVENSVEIFLCTAGRSAVRYGDDRYEITAGDVFLCFPNQPHGYFDSDQVEGYILVVPIKPLLTPYYNTLMYMLPHNPVVRDSGWQSNELGVLLEIALKERKEAQPEIMQGYLQVIVGKVLSMFCLESRESVTNEALREIVFYLNAHYTEPVTRKQLASAVGYNESYISHIFSQALKTSLPRYLNSLRVYDATRLLRETEMPVARIALELGFGSIRTFNRVFLEETGKTPRAYRAEGR